jgi:hypothetical protein
LGDGPKEQVIRVHSILDLPQASQPLGMTNLSDDLPLIPRKFVIPTGACVVEGPAVRLYRPEICGRDGRTVAYFALIALRICASASSLQYLQLSCKNTDV